LLNSFYFASIHNMYPLFTVMLYLVSRQRHQFYIRWKKVVLFYSLGAIIVISHLRCTFWCVGNKYFIFIIQRAPVKYEMVFEIFPYCYIIFILRYHYLPIELHGKKHNNKHIVMSSECVYFLILILNIYLNVYCNLW